jgi:hypothetical protein
MVFHFSLHLSVDQFLLYYQGAASKIEVVDSRGRRLWIHGRHFRPFVTENGIQGQFELELDKNGNFLSLTKR